MDAKISEIETYDKYINIIVVEVNDWGNRSKPWTTASLLHRCNERSPDCNALL